MYACNSDEYSLIFFMSYNWASTYCWFGSKQLVLFFSSTVPSEKVREKVEIQFESLLFFTTKFRSVCFCWHFSVSEIFIKNFYYGFQIHLYQIINFNWDKLKESEFFENNGNLLNRPLVSSLKPQKIKLFIQIVLGYQLRKISNN